MKVEAGLATALSLGGVFAVLAGAPFGLVAASAGIAACAVAVVPLPLIVIHRKCGLGVRDILLPQVPAFVASCGIGTRGFRCCDCGWRPPTFQML